MMEKITVWGYIFVLTMFCLMTTPTLNAEEYFDLKSPLTFHERTLIGKVSKADLKKALETYHIRPEVPLVLMRKGQENTAVEVTTCPGLDEWLAKGWAQPSLWDLNTTGLYIELCDTCEILLKAKPLSVISPPFSFSDNIGKLMLEALPQDNSVFLSRLFPPDQDLQITIKELEAQGGVKIDRESPYKIRLIFSDGDYMVFKEFATAQFDNLKPMTLVSVLSGCRGVLTVTRVCYFYWDPQTGHILRHVPDIS